MGYLWIMRSYIFFWDRGFQYGLEGADRRVSFRGDSEADQLPKTYDVDPFPALRYPEIYSIQNVVVRVVADLL